MKRNVPIFGLLIGIIFPILGMLVVYLINSAGASFPEFLHALASKHKEAAAVLSLSLVANAIPFIYYTNKRLDLTARGILIATMIYAVLIVLLKYVW
ncbi:MAG: hypothetical protein JST52_03655 [Bacteroidetes bacterium]|nr:hypothetical protein [Bacteroidota bacterium]MBS1741005.1 hypothetical protein [Bacteroidota bacterium]MBS1774977.1 hypothetical protein [Bacteroidota bacterium]